LVAKNKPAAGVTKLEREWEWWALDRDGRIFLPGDLMASRQATLEYLTTTKIGEKGQLTVPKQFRKDLGLGTGAPFAVLRLGDGLVLLPEQKRFERLCEQISSALRRGGVTPEVALASLPGIRKRLYERRYKKADSSSKASRRKSGAQGK
jgi:AbrB family looped-hinge helix DNA binding protein